MEQILKRWTKTPMCDQFFPRSTADAIGCRWRIGIYACENIFAGHFAVLLSVVTDCFRVCFFTRAHVRIFFVFSLMPTLEFSSAVFQETYATRLCWMLIEGAPKTPWFHAAGCRRFQGAFYWLPHDADNYYPLEYLHTWPL